MKAIKARLSKFSTVDEFIAGWGSYYFSGGLLLPTRNTEPAGTSVSLHIQISTGETVLRGEGTVEAVRTNSSGKPVGMMIGFTKLDAASKELIRQILDHKKKSRTSASESVVKGATVSALTDQATGENLAASEIGAVADELEQTFDSIFSGSFLSADSASEGEFGDTGAPTPSEELATEDEDAEDDTGATAGTGYFGGDPTMELDDDALQAAAAADAVDQAGPDKEPIEPNDFELPGVMDTDSHETQPGEEPAELGDPAPTLDEAELQTGPEKTDAEDGPADETDASEPAEEVAPEPDEAPEPRLPQSPPNELQPENRVSSFIDEVTGGSASSSGETLLTHEETEDSPMVTSLADAAAKAAASAAEREAALDDMRASASMSSPSVASSPELLLPVRTRPKGRLERFFTWLKELFD